MMYEYKRVFVLHMYNFRIQFYSLMQGYLLISTQLCGSVNMMEWIQKWIYEIYLV